VPLIKDFTKVITRVYIDTSDITLDKLELAPKKVQNILKQVPDKYLRIVESNTETEDLAKQYINRKTYMTQ
jgi:hypothetical protein